MATSKLELAVGTGQWDAGLKKAQQALNSFTQAQGGLQQALAKDNGDMQKFIQMMAKMDSTANTSKGQMNDYKRVLEQLTAQYNQMSDAQKKSIGQDYLQTIDSLKQKFSQAKQQVEDFNKSLGEAGKVKMPESSGGGLFGGGKLDGMLQVFGGNLMTKGASMLADLGAEMGDMVKQGIELARQSEGIRVAFERLNQPGLLDNLREATHGTVTNLELMKAAVKFADFKLPLDQLGTMLAFAQKKAKDTGQSVDYMVDSIVTGLGRKSLMILDNLGLSANEVKEKMKETGDMTKAVGEIIREQMAKAGGYVETAADRATQADVRLKNAMEDLGNTLMPLTDAGVGLFAQWKVSALDFLNSAMKPLIQSFTQLGAIQKIQQNVNGGGFMSRITENLRNSNNKDLQYSQQLMAINRSINKAEANLQEARKGGKGSIQIYENRLQALKNIRDEYIKVAQSIMNTDSAVAAGDGGTIGNDGKKSGKKSGKTTKVEPVYASDSIAAQEKLVSDLTKKWKEAGAAVRDDYAVQLGYAKQRLAEMTGGFDPGKMKDISGQSVNLTQDTEKLNDLQAQRKKAIASGDTELSKNLLEQINQVKSDPNGLTLPVKLEIKSPVEQWQSEIKRLQEEMNTGLWSTEAIQAYSERVDQLQKQVSEFSGNLDKGGENSSKSWSNAATAIGSVGNAINSIEDPTAKIVGLVAQGIASVVSATGIATEKAAGQSRHWAEYLAAAASITAQMIATISQIHSASGYANGGIVKGNSYSGDNIPADTFVNAGELILNKSQQGAIASQLQNGNGGLRVTGVLRGEDLLISIDKSARRQGRGELVFWKNQ